jgi:hypothetical protein
MLVINIINCKVLQVNVMKNKVTKAETQYIPAPADAKNEIWSFLETIKLRVTCRPRTGQEVSPCVFWEFQCLTSAERVFKNLRLYIYYSQ